MFMIVCAYKHATLGQTIGRGWRGSSLHRGPILLRPAPVGGHHNYNYLHNNKKPSLHKYPFTLRFGAGQITQPTIQHRHSLLNDNVLKKCLAWEAHNISALFYNVNKLNPSDSSEKKRPGSTS